MYMYISFPGVIIPIIDNDHSILSIASFHVRSNVKVFLIKKTH